MAFCFGGRVLFFVSREHLIHDRSPPRSTGIYGLEYVYANNVSLHECAYISVHKLYTRIFVHWNIVIGLYESERKLKEDTVEKEWPLEARGIEKRERETERGTRGPKKPASRSDSGHIIIARHH